MVQAVAVSVLAAALAAVGVLGTVLTDASQVDLVREIGQLDAPTLLVLFIVLLYKRKLVWGYQLDAALDELSQWKAAAQARTSEAEHAATIAEEALHAGIRHEARQRRGR